MLAKIDNVDKLDVILAGDFNIDVSLDGTTREILYSSLEDYGLKQLIEEPTRNKKSSTCIDLIFTNILNVETSGVAIVNISDHLPVYITIKNYYYLIIS